MPDCLIGLGANLGDRQAMLDSAAALLAAHPQIRILSQSKRRETLPVGGPAGQGPFLNAAMLISTSLAPDDLLMLLLDLEQQLGRQRSAQRWSAREIDLDLLLYDEQVIADERLTVPHPRMAFRRFVLEAAADVAPEMAHPTTGLTIRQLLDHLDKAPNYIAVTSAAPGDAAPLAAGVSHASKSRLLACNDVPQKLALLQSTNHANRTQAAIDLLQGRAALLQSASPWSNGCVSDFWLGECLAFARAALTPPEFDLFRAAWTPISAGAPVPKLLVVCDRPVGRRGGALAGGGPLESQLSEPLAERLESSLAAQTAPPTQCAVLHVSVQNLPLAVDDVAAAIAAMQ